MILAIPAPGEDCNLLQIFFCKAHSIRFVAPNQGSDDKLSTNAIFDLSSYFHQKEL